MTQRGGDLNLPPKSLLENKVRNFRADYLEGDQPSMSRIFGEIYRAHAAATQLALKHVAPGES